MRSQGDSKPGALPADPNSSAMMRQVVSERDLYRQLTHFLRLVDADRLLERVEDEAKRNQAALRLAPIRSAMDAAAATVSRLQCLSAHKWVDLKHLCCIMPIPGR